MHCFDGLVKLQKNLLHTSWHFLYMSLRIGVVSLVVVTLDSSINTCFEDSDGNSPAGPVVIIDTDQNISSVTFTLSFDEFVANTVCGQADDFHCG